MNNIKYILLSVIGLFSCFAINAQYSTRPYQAKVNALQVYRSGWANSYPVIYANNASEAIQMSFDILDVNMHQVTYSVFHCNADWTPSDLSPNEYLDGFQSNYVEDYAFSQSTTVNYVNYQLQLPNDDVVLKLSGNYTVVFYDEDEQDTLATACFSIVDQRVDIVGSVGGLSVAGNSKKMQQLNFKVDHSNYAISQPIIETQVVVKQNNSSLHQVMNSTPTYIYADRLVYEQQPCFAFLGGDEYHLFETSSLRFAGKGIQDVSFFSPFYHANLRVDKCRSYLVYNFDNDINGKFLIRRQESDDDEMATEADYVMVHFALEMYPPLLDARIFVGGAFSYNMLDEAHRMRYNNDKKRYEGSVLVKQGYYNYRYYVVDNRTKAVLNAPVELDAYQTENDYLIFFYHRPLGERYDCLIGYQVINTLNK